ncbi:50S ribosomal protein L9 [Buchnera aphidicola (Kurisakia onigurumii)]|uniref:50S ribosomal protein L9 n=1 Tax=Buchnera aphidicola TaxID=9 RepID=UPI0031B6E1A2
MKIILISTVQKIGSKGDCVNVKSGYARNFLIPKGKAILATKENINCFHEKQKIHEKKLNKKISLSKEKINQIKKIQPIIIYAKSGEEGKLFGSIGIRDIYKSVLKLGIQVEKNNFKLRKGKLRTIGEHNIIFQPHTDLFCNVIIKIVAEKS